MTERYATKPPRELRPSRKTRNLIADICRITLGLMFIVSGFTKTIDPWGTAIKITEYLNTFGFETLNNYRFGFAIWFCAAELMMGLMLTFKIKTRLISIFAVLVMTFFTVLTFLAATWFPVEDCGCFGDAIKLSPWASFGKNVVLLSLAVVVWLNARRTLAFFPVTRKEWICTILFAGIAGGLGAYSYFHLPLIDFLPYRKGVNLYEAIYSGGGTDEDIKLVYRDRTDGSLHEFLPTDTTWYDSGRWEFVEQADAGSFEPDVALREFAIFNSAGDATREIVGYGGRVYLLAAVKLDKIKPYCAERFAMIARRAAEENALAVLLTSSPLGGQQSLVLGAGVEVPVYNIDATTMITMLRAATGMVVLDHGVITAKKNCRDIRPERRVRVNEESR